MWQVISNGHTCGLWDQLPFWLRFLTLLESPLMHFLTLLVKPQGRWSHTKTHSLVNECTRAHTHTHRHTPPHTLLECEAAQRSIQLPPGSSRSLPRGKSPLGKVLQSHVMSGSGGSLKDPHVPNLLCCHTSCQLFWWKLNVSRGSALNRQRSHSLSLSLWGCPWLYIDFHSFVQPNPNLYINPNRIQFMPYPNLNSHLTT